MSGLGEKMGWEGGRKRGAGPGPRRWVQSSVGPPLGVLGITAVVAGKPLGGDPGGWRKHGLRNCAAQTGREGGRAESEGRGRSTEERANGARGEKDIPQARRSQSPLAEPRFTTPWGEEALASGGHE